MPLLSIIDSEIYITFYAIFLDFRTKKSGKRNSYLYHTSLSETKSLARIPNGMRDISYTPDPTFSIHTQLTLLSNRNLLDTSGQLLTSTSFPSLLLAVQPPSNTHTLAYIIIFSVFLLHMVSHPFFFFLNYALSFKSP